MNYDDLKEYVAEALRFDWVQMADIVDAVQRQAGDDADGATVIRDAGIGAVRLVQDGILIPGDITDSGFAPWPTSVAESTDRISREVDEVAEQGGDIDLGEVAWFASPEQVAR